MLIKKFSLCGTKVFAVLKLKVHGEAQNGKSLCTTSYINFASSPPSDLHEHPLLSVLEPLALLLSLLLCMLLLLV
jgi:hypothetical protein